MALAPVNPTRISIGPAGTAAYSLILASAPSTPEASQSVLIFPDGVDTTVAGNAIATTGTDATGLFTSPVSLIPGCLYWVACPNDGGWTTTQFTAPPIVGKVILNGGSAGPQAISGTTVAINGTTSVIVTSPVVELGSGSLGANNGIVRKSDLQTALTAFAALVAPYASGPTVTAPTATASTISKAE